MIWLKWYQYPCRKYLDDMLSCVETSRSSSNDANLWAAGRQGRLAAPTEACEMSNYTVITAG